MWWGGDGEFRALILETTAEVLARHIPPEEQRSAIIREIEGEAQTQ